MGNWLVCSTMCKSGKFEGVVERRAHSRKTSDLTLQGMCSQVVVCLSLAFRNK